MSPNICFFFDFFCLVWSSSCNRILNSLSRIEFTTWNRPVAQDRRGQKSHSEYKLSELHKETKSVRKRNRAGSNCFTIRVWVRRQGSSHVWQASSLGIIHCWSELGAFFFIYFFIFILLFHLERRTESVSFFFRYKKVCTTTGKWTTLSINIVNQLKIITNSHLNSKNVSPNQQRKQRKNKNLSITIVQSQLYKIH